MFDLSMLLVSGHFEDKNKHGHACREHGKGSLFCCMRVRTCFPMLSGQEKTWQNPGYSTFNTCGGAFFELNDVLGGMLHKELLDSPFKSTCVTSVEGLTRMDSKRSAMDHTLLTNFECRNTVGFLNLPLCQ